MVIFSSSLQQFGRLQIIVCWMDKVGNKLDANAHLMVVSKMFLAVWKLTFYMAM